MIQRVVFSKGSWLTVKIPQGYDPAWTDSDFWHFAVTWAAAKLKGFQEIRCEQIAEAVVSKRLYPDLSFYKDLERDIKSLVERA